MSSRGWPTSTASHAGRVCHGSLYLKLLLRHAFQWPALLLAAGGLGLGIVRLVRGPGRVRWALAVVFPLLYLWMIRGQRIIFARYLLPAVPPLCVLAATAVVSGVSLLRRYEIPRAPRTALIAGLTIAALLPPALMSIRWDRDAARTGTVDLAYEWILQNVPPQVGRGDRIARAAPAGHLPVPEHCRSCGPWSTPQWRDQKVDYLVASSQYYDHYFLSPEKFPREYAEYMRIFEQSRELVRFSPSQRHTGTRAPHLQGDSLTSLDRRITTHGRPERSRRATGSAPSRSTPAVARC